MSISRKSFFVVVCLIFSVSAWAQVTRTPFSAFGHGERYGHALINNQGMAGVGIAQPQYWYANNTNPALLVYNNLTVFHAGLLVERRTTTADTISQQGYGGNLNYLVTAFPIKPTRWSTGIALSPFSTVNYKMGYEGVVEGTTEPIAVQEEGSGGLSQLSWSNGVALSKSLAVGLRASYVFGSMLNTFRNQLTESEQPANYISAIEERSYVKDFIFNAGVSYNLDSIFSRERYRLSFGATYDFATDLKNRRRTILYRTNSLGDVVDPDTLATSTGRISLPAGFTVGVALSQGTRWTIGTEFAYSDWSSYSDGSEQSDSFQESFRFALGGEYTPDGVSGTYFKRITYRTGFSMEQYPYLPNGKKMTDVGINFGFSLPAGQSSLDLAFRYGQRGDRNENLFEEDYFRVFFGVTFNDRWFIKRRFD